MMIFNEEEVGIAAAATLALAVLHPPMHNAHCHHYHLYHNHHHHQQWWSITITCYLTNCHQSPKMHFPPESFFFTRSSLDLEPQSRFKNHSARWINDFPRLKKLHKNTCVMLLNGRRRDILLQTLFFPTETSWSRQNGNVWWSITWRVKVAQRFHDFHTKMIAGYWSQIFPPICKL